MPENCIETLSISFARLTVLESDAVWLVPYGAVRHDLEQGHLSRLAVDTSGTEEPVGMLRRSDATAGHGANSLMKMIVHAADIRRPHSAASPLFSKEA